MTSLSHEFVQEKREGEGEPEDSHIEKPIDTANILNIS